ncbi:hypothetical protein K1T71_012280 [Dendrolimus kikuchii]|uniref:Uncharacterized protein n=1 Tax=Dendrolimus kikuchii TaxID=765133 RepID=A0ACC1CL59_9NEOP|nr:hypothetical protein K1T71_012280 [Dendrolimus kikuchii]
MVIGKIIILVVRFALSLQHYIPPPDSCLQAKFCNHTWHEECGIETTDSNKRLFLDLCDMYEYNCDYNKDTTTTEVSITAIDTQYTTAESTTLLLASTTEKSMTNQSISTNFPTTESFEITINNSTIVDTTVDSLNTIQNKYITTTKNTTLVVTSVVSSILTILNNSTTEANNITINENTIPHSTVNTVSATLESNKTKISDTTSSPNVTCSVYPDDCDRPKTWETTVKGERRDFFQIMRDRFGINAVALEDTTNRPRRAYRETNSLGQFLFDRHSGSNKIDSIKLL